MDGERALVAVRATGGSADAALGAAHLAAGVTVASFEIEDLLVGARCPAHAYLARSFEAPGARPTRASTLSWVCMRVCWLWVWEPIETRAISLARTQHAMFGGTWWDQRGALAANTASQVLGTLCHAARISARRPRPCVMLPSLSDAPRAGSAAGTDGDEFYDAAAEPGSPGSARSLSRASVGAESFGSAAAPGELEGESPRSGAGASKGAPCSLPLWRVPGRLLCRGAALGHGSLPALELRWARCEARAAAHSGAGRAQPRADPDPKPDAARAAAGSPPETGSGRAAPAWALDFETWARGSAEYAGVDSELRMRLTTLFFFLNRPTVAALMAVGSAMAAAVKDPAAPPPAAADAGAGAGGAGEGAERDGRPDGAASARAGSGVGLAEAAEEGADAALDASTASPSEAGDAGAPGRLGRPPKPTPRGPALQSRPGACARRRGVHAARDAAHRAVR